MIIPHHQLSPEALLGLIEDFVTRDGTDYGECEVPLETKVAQVYRQLKLGVSVIAFNEENQSCTILLREQLPAAPQPD